MSEAANKPHHQFQPVSSPVMWAVVITAVILTRFIDLGAHSPWLDEVMNWIIADRWGLQWRPNSGHELTYILQSIGLSVFNNEYGLRLYSAIFGALAVVVVTAWANHRLGHWHALIIGLLHALSPFAIFYSQDANHYAPLLLGGVLSTVSIDWLLEGNKQRWILLASMILYLAAAFAFHPFAILVLAAFALQAYLWLMAHPEKIPIPKAHHRTRRLLLTLAALVPLSMVLTAFLNKAFARSGYVIGESRDLGFAWEPWQALLADFFGAIYHHQFPDILLGIIGIALSAIGLRGLCKERKWAAVGGLITIAVCTLPFIVFTFYHYFSPRYLIAALPPLLIGSGYIIANTLRPFAFRKRLVITTVVALWCILFVVRFAMWETHRWQADHQPSRQAMEWIRDESPEDAIFVTKHRYSSRAARFLWNQYDMGTRELIALNDQRTASLPVIQQIEEILHRHDRPVFFISFLEIEFTDSPQLKGWIEKQDLVTLFSSGSPDEYVPLDWSIPIWRISPTDKNPVGLPKDGNRLSGICNDQKVRGFLASRESRLSFPPHTGGHYFFDLDKPAKGLALKASITSGEKPLQLLASIDEKEYFLWEFDRTEEAISNCVIEYPLEAGDHSLHLYVTTTQRTHLIGQESLQILELDTWKDEIGNTLFAQSMTSIPGALTESGHKLEPSNIETGILKRESLNVPNDLADHQIVVVQWLKSGGLNDYALMAYVSAGKRRYTMTPVTRWTYGWAMTAAILPAEVSDNEVTVEWRIRNAASFRPVDGGLELKPPIVLSPVREP